MFWRACIRPQIIGSLLFRRECVCVSVAWYAPSFISGTFKVAFRWIVFPHSENGHVQSPIHKGEWHPPSHLLYGEGFSYSWNMDGWMEWFIFGLGYELALVISESGGSFSILRLAHQAVVMRYEQVGRDNPPSMGAPGANWINLLWP